MSESILPPSNSPCTAVVLSGGGARGAYEVGVLSYLFGDFVRYFGRWPSVEIVCGTSVGAINACHLVANMAHPIAGVRRLSDLWTGLELSRVMKLSFRQIMDIPRMLRGSSDGRPVGIFDVRPLIELVNREVSWRALSSSMRSGKVRALSVSTTEIATGRTTVFVDAHPGMNVPASLGPRVHVQSTRIGPEHALASAAIPLAFPPVRIGPLLYCDGGLRQNTPIAPAIRLGAERVFVISLSREVRGSVVPETGPDDTRVPSVSFLLGKVLNAFLLDHVQSDIELLGRINQLLSDGERVFGPSFTERLSAESQARGHDAYRSVRSLVLRPSEDLGVLAGQHLRKNAPLAPLLVRQLLQALTPAGQREADLASYFLFDGSFARKLIDLGRADAEAKRDQIAAFFA